MSAVFPRLSQRGSGKKDLYYIVVTWRQGFLRKWYVNFDWLSILAWFCNQWHHIWSRLSSWLAKDACARLRTRFAIDFSSRFRPRLSLQTLENQAFLNLKIVHDLVFWDFQFLILGEMERVPQYLRFEQIWELNLARKGSDCSLTVGIFLSTNPVKCIRGSALTPRKLSP